MDNCQLCFKFPPHPFSRVRWGTGGTDCHGRKRPRNDRGVSKVGVIPRERSDRGNLFLRLPRQCAHWLAMTEEGRWCGIIVNCQLSIVHCPFTRCAEPSVSLGMTGFYYPPWGDAFLYGEIWKTALTFRGKEGRMMLIH